MPNEEGIAAGTALGRDDAVCRALRFLLLREAERIRNEEPRSFWETRGITGAMALYEELGGVTE